MGLFRKKKVVQEPEKLFYDLDYNKIKSIADIKDVLKFVFNKGFSVDANVNLTDPRLANLIDKGILIEKP